MISVIGSRTEKIWDLVLIGNKYDDYILTHTHSCNFNNQLKFPREKFPRTVQHKISRIMYNKYVH